MSHDRRFLERLTRALWEIAPDPQDPAGRRLRLAEVVDGATSQAPGDPFAYLVDWLAQHAE